MQDSIKAKLIKLSERLSEIEKKLIEESSSLNQDDLISLNKEFSHIQPIVDLRAGISETISAILISPELRMSSSVTD